jgi:hypothetical protein
MSEPVAKPIAVAEPVGFASAQPTLRKWRHLPAIFIRLKPVGQSMISEDMQRLHRAIGVVAAPLHPGPS